MTALQRLLHSLIVGAPEASTSSVPVTAALLAEAEEQGVALLLHDLLEDCNQLSCSVETRQALRHIAKRETAIEFARFFSTTLVLRAMGEAGIRTLLLKGSALAYWLYVNPAQRSRCDLDVLVADKAAATAATAALERAGYRLGTVTADESADFETALERTLPGGSLHRVDLHWRVLNNARLAGGMDFDDLWKGSIEIPGLGRNARGLGVPDALLHALLHRVTNMPSGQHDRLIWLYDIHLLALRCVEEDWQALLHSCTRMRCAMPCLDGLRASRNAFDTELPVAVERALQDGVSAEHWQLEAFADQGAMDRLHLAALSWPQKFAWLRRKLFPSAAFMRQRYGGPGGMGLAGAYLHRWWVGLRRAAGA